MIIYIQLYLYSNNTFFTNKQIWRLCTTIYYIFEKIFYLFIKKLKIFVNSNRDINFSDSNKLVIIWHVYNFKQRRVIYYFHNTYNWIKSAMMLCMKYLPLDVKERSWINLQSLNYSIWSSMCDVTYWKKIELYTFLKGRILFINTIFLYPSKSDSRGFWRTRQNSHHSISKIT